MEDKKDYGDLFSKESKEVKEEPKSEKKPQYKKQDNATSRKGKVANIAPAWITVEMSDGTGERIAFDAKKHSSLKKGDVIEVPSSVWIKKEQEIKEQAVRDAMIKIEKYRELVATRQGTHKYDSCYDDCLKILKDIL